MGKELTIEDELNALNQMYRGAYEAGFKAGYAKKEAELKEKFEKEALDMAREYELASNEEYGIRK